MVVASVFNKKRIMVFGLGITGVSATKALSLGGANVIAWDDNEKARDNIQNKEITNVVLKDFREVDWKDIDALILGAGVPLTYPKPHLVVDYAKSVSCPIICDVEILYRQETEAFYIGITGTNGKSTTTSLIGKIFQDNNIESKIGGNLGTSATDFESLSKGGVYILEMSSYQLDLIDKTKFNISLLINISPDHLDRHGGMEGYIQAKCNIYKNQGSSEIAVIGVDDKYSLSVYKDLKQSGKIGRIIPISSLEFQKGGVSVIDGFLFNDIDQANEKISLKGLKLKGIHNFQNIAASFACAYLYGIDKNKIIDSTLNFLGIKHRMQLVRKIGKVEFVNDSKATNCSSASKSLMEYNDIFWIAGGISKGDDISSLSKFFPKIRKAFLVGRAKEEFAFALKGKVECVSCETLDEAFKYSSESAFLSKCDNPVVLLAPACSSFDQWKNFEERGNYFCTLVDELAKKNI